MPLFALPARLGCTAAAPHMSLLLPRVLLCVRREAVASAAWVSSERGLLSALEMLPGILTDWTNDDAGGEAWDVTCAACNRRRWAGQSLGGRHAFLAWQDWAL
jgi:hypothetical protein